MIKMKKIKNVKLSKNKSNLHRQPEDVNYTLNYYRIFFQFNNKINFI